MPATRLHALVTGASGGIGRGICLALIAQARRDGRDIHLSAAASAQGPKLDAVLDELRAAGASATGLAADLTDAQQCDGLIEHAISSGGDLDTLVCNAGASGPGRLLDLPLAQWEQTFSLNTRAPWLLARAAHASLARTQGSIVAIASMSGQTPHPGYGAYSSAKAALIMLCRQMAQEWAVDGIRVNVVCPGMIRTPLTESVYQDEATHQQRRALVPLGRIGHPDDVGAAVAFLASGQAAYITGQELQVDGGISSRMLSLIPGRPGKPPVQT